MSKSPDNAIIFKNNKDKIFMSYIKHDIKTKTYNTVKDDNLTPTLYAFYNCDKSRQVLSDKEAAVVKGMRIENKIEMNEDNICFNFKNKNQKAEKDNYKDIDMVIFIIIFIRLAITLSPLIAFIVFLIDF